jgi:hypothetical protein
MCRSGVGVLAAAERSRCGAGEGTCLGSMQQHRSDSDGSDHMHAASEVIACRCLCGPHGRPTTLIGAIAS